MPQETSLTTVRRGDIQQGNNMMPQETSMTTVRRGDIQ